VAAALTWRVGRRMVGERLAQVAGLLVWVAPGAYVWWSTKERGFYWVTMVVGLVVVLAAQRIVEPHDRSRAPDGPNRVDLAPEKRWVLDGALFGIAAGLGFWASPAILYFAVPAGLWVVLRRRPPLAWLAAGVPAAVLGALPWLWHNLGHGMPSLDRPPQPEYVSYVGGMGRLAWRTLPMALNLRYPISERWLVPVVAPLVLAGLGVALVVAAIRRPSPPVLLLAVLAVFPLIYAWFPGAWFVGEGRYAVFASPFLALASVWLVRRPWAGIAVAAASAVVSVIVLDPMGFEPPRHVGADLATLERGGVDRVWADYWFAYRLAFESDRRLVASSSVSSREPSVFAAVAADPTPAFLYPRRDPRIRRLLRAVDLPHRLVRTPHFVVVVFDGTVDPLALPAGIAP